MLAANFLAEYLPLGGKNTGEISNQFSNLFTPAPVTFAIWSIIYITLLIFSVYQLSSVFSRKENIAVEGIVHKIGGLFILVNILNATWIVAWHYQQIAVSVLIMTILLITLLRLNIHLGVGLSSFNTREKYISHLPFALYLGWISIATIANITAFLVSINWDGFGLSAVFWTVAMITTGTLITLFVVLRTNNIFYGLAVIWAFIGIIAKRYAFMDAEPYLIIPYAAMLGIILILIAVLVKIRSWQRY
jgi:hypothetical protein